MLRPCALLLFLALLSTACAEQPKATVRKGRIISITDSIATSRSADTIRFGHLGSGEIVEVKLWIANNTPRPIAITSYERSCGCTTLEFDSEPIAVGDAQHVTLRYNSRGEHGWQLRSLDVAIAGAKRPLRLLVEAEVK